MMLKILTVFQKTSDIIVDPLCDISPSLMITVHAVERINCRGHSTIQLLSFLHFPTFDKIRRLLALQSW
jgi:hypothetical protein